MRAFEISVNRKKFCLAGIGEEGVLAAGVDWVAGVRGKRKGDGDLFFHVGGLVMPAQTHVSWGQHHLQVGDEIRIEIVETPTADEPPHREMPLNPAEQLKAKKRHVRMVAKELGWSIQARPKQPAG